MQSQFRITAPATDDLEAFRRSLTRSFGEAGDATIIAISTDRRCQSAAPVLVVKVGGGDMSQRQQDILDRVAYIAPSA